MNAYETAALAEAKRQGLASADVAALKYAAVAALAGVPLGPKGESPADFFYVHVRRAVEQELAANESAVAEAQREAAITSAVTASPALAKAKVVKNDDGTFTLKWDKAAVAREAVP